MGEPARVVTKKSIGDHIRAVGAYSILLGFLGIGATITSLFWSSAYAKLQVDLKHAQDAAVQAEGELAAVKSEYAQFQAQTEHEPQSEPIGSSGSPEAASASAEETEAPTNKTATKVTVSTGQTEAVFDGVLLISLVENAFEGDPLRHKVIATVGSPGYPSKKMDRADVGYELVYDGNGGKYAIRVTAASTFTATFLVTRLSDESKEAR